MDSNILVIYHGNCWDGFCAAWLFHKVYPDAEFVPAQYGQDPPDCTGKRVFIVDFSYKRELMRRIMSQAAFVCVLDHHKTAKAELDGLVNEFLQRPDLIHNPIGSELPVIWFNMEMSGGRLAWEYLFGRDYRVKYSNPDDLRSWLVNYTEDRDLWRHILPNSREVNAALRSYPLDFAWWDDLDARGLIGNSPPCSLVSEGAAILRSERQVIDNHVRHAREIEMDGHKVLAVNATVLFSEIAGELAAGRPFGAAYFDRGNGKRQWSLRSSDAGVDVSEIAKRHGGGGHRNAAGFEEVLP